MSTIAADENEDSGFGLLEFLVVLLLVSGISLACVPMLGQLPAIRDRQSQTMEVQALHSVARHIVRTIESAEQIILPVNGRDKHGMFLSGNSHEVSFNAVVRRGVNTAGLSQVRLFISRENTVAKLVQEHRDRRGQTQTALTLGVGVDELILSYLHSDPVSGTEDWKTDWQVPGKLPPAIRFTIRRTSRSGSVVSAEGIAVLFFN